jgi:hypothetical protein
VTENYFAASDYEYDSAHEAPTGGVGAPRVEGAEGEQPHGMPSGSKGDNDDGDYGYDEAHDLWQR